MNRSFGRPPSMQSDKSKLMLVGGLLVVALLLVVAAVALLPGKTQTAATKTVVVETEKTEPTVKMVDVLVPVQAIEAGATLEPAMFRKETRPQIGVSPRVIRDFEEIQNQFARSLIVPGQPLHRDYVTNVKPTNKITANIPEGFRAVTISVNANSSVEGWVRPGAKVDVAWTSTVRGQPGLTIIVENARVLSVDRDTNQNQQNAQPGAAVPPTVTLLVSAPEAQRIQLAQTTGALTLQLRGDPDTGKTVGASTLTVSDLYGGGKTEKIQECQGEVTMGGKKYCLTQSGELKPKE